MGFLLPPPSGHFQIDLSLFEVHVLLDELGFGSVLKGSQLNEGVRVDHAWLLT